MAKAKKPAQRGFVNNIILESLLTGDKYGYEIIKEVEEKSNGEIILKQPSLYSSLKRFEMKGFITSYWGDSDIGGRRHYYTITEIGKNYYYTQVSSEKNPTPKKASSSASDIIKNNVTIEDILTETDDISQQNFGYSISDKEDVIAIETVVAAEHKKQPVYDTASDEYDIFEILEKEETAVSTPTTPQSATTNSESAIQDDMFTSDNHATEDISGEQLIDTGAINELKSTDTSLPLDAELSRTNTEIPLIKEQEQKFLNWENLKREIVHDKTENHTEHPVYNTEIQLEEHLVANDDVLNSSDTFIEFESIEAATSEEFSEVILTDNKTIIETKPLGLDNVTLQDDNTVTKEVTTEQIVFEDTNQHTQNTTSPLTGEQLDSGSDSKEATVDEKVKIVVDEFGIMRSAKDIAPKKTNTVFDNVGERIEFTDPIDIKKKKEKRAENKTLETHVKQNKYEDYDAYTKQNYEDKERSIVDKLSRIIKEKKSIDYKDLLGDLYFDENELQEIKSDNETIKMSDEDDMLNHPVHVATFDSTKDNERIRKTASYTALEDSLTKDGFKFKPYSFTLSEKKKPAEFLLMNKALFNFGLAFFLIALLQLGVLMITLYQNKYNFKNIDIIIASAYLVLTTLILIFTTLPYLKHRKKRGLSTFKLNTSLLFALLVFINTIVITYAINALFGLQLDNFSEYIVTLLVPILFSFNFILAPFIYVLVINNKKLY